MSYKKMMKWNTKHRRGVRQAYMGFNTSGITSEEIKSREETFVKEMRQKTLEERKEYWENVKEIINVIKKYDINVDCIRYMI